VITNDHDCGVASAITPGNDDGGVLAFGCLVGSDVGEVGCQVSSPVGSNVGSSVPLQSCLDSITKMVMMCTWGCKRLLNCFHTLNNHMMATNSLFLMLNVSH
jgi:hypothetical protein